MSSERADLDERDFQASLDGRLSPERAAAVEAYLAAHPDEKARYERDAELRRALRAAWAAELDEPVPSGLRVARLSAERRRRQYWQVGAIAAALVLFVLGGIGGWTARNAGLGLMSSTRAPGRRPSAKSPPMPWPRTASSRSRCATRSKSTPPSKPISSNGCRDGLATRCGCPISTRPGFN